MKKAMLLGLAVLFLTVAPNAYALHPYVALFGDTLTGPGGAEHSKCSVFVPAPYTSVELWIWFKPDMAKGVSAAEFKLTYPTTTYVIQGPVTSNPLNQVELGSLGAGMSVSVGEYFCQHDWYWTHWQELVVKSLTARTVMVVGHPGNGGHIYLASCEPGFPMYNCTVLNHFFLNQNCNIGTHDSSWGAIKNLYTE